MLERLWKFRGGVHPPGRKELSLGHPLRRAELPARLILPLQQHIGAPAEPAVSPGDEVLKGEVIARASGLISAPVHAPTSGKIIEIADHPVPHPSGMSAPCIVLEPDGREQWIADREAIDDFLALEPDELRARIRNAGIVGLGGAAFPTSVKLDPGAGRTVDTLIINGAECEPYITSDDLLMRERSDQVVGGLRIMRHALGARQVLIGIEDNKPEALGAMRKAVQSLDDATVRVVALPTRYPTGGERQLIRVLTGREVPSGKRPLDIGVVCHNLSTAAAVYRAIKLGEPLISRIVTVTGKGVAQPQNIEALFGTPIEDLINQCGGYTEGVSRLILGGPMMGFSLRSDRVPVVKAANCVLVARQDELADSRPTLPCIRCGRCSKACPAYLLPQQMYWHARAKDFDRVQDHNLFDCIECGCCAYVCPSNIPLVQYFRFAKNEIWAQEREQRKTEESRLRHEAKLARVEREKREKEERMRIIKEAAQAKQREEAKERPGIQHATTSPAPKATGDSDPRARITELEKRRGTKGPTTADRPSATDQEDTR
ncbi:MAG: hypothetical protein Kow006_15480 [Gammaproteobacteria bacterium]